MSYIYRLPDNYSLIPNDEKFDLNYLSVKNMPSYIYRTGDIAIYGKNENGEGIFGFGEIMGEKAVKTSLIDPEKKNKFFKRNYFQIEVKLGSLSTEPFIYIRYLRHSPSFNSKSFQLPYNPFVLYWAGGIHWEYKYPRYIFSYDFSLSSDSIILSDRHWRFYIHILREKSINHFWNNKLPKEKNHCNACGLKSDYPYFLEIHDTAKIDFDADFKPVSIKDFIVLCPNCHKKEHLQMRDNKEESILIYPT